MKIKSISISRRSTYEINDASPELFKGTVMLEGNGSYDPDISIRLNPEQLEGVMHIVAPAMAQAISDTLAGAHAEITADMHRLALPATDTVDME